MSEHGQNLDTDVRVLLSPSWVLREEDGGEALLFNADTGDVWVANRTAVAVWQHVDGERTVADLLTDLARTHEGFDEEAERQVMDLLRELTEAGALTVAR